MLARRVWPSRPTFESAFADFDQVRREMLRLLDAVAGDHSTVAAGAGVFPPLNVTQDNDHFYVRAEIPGVSARDISISALNNRLSVAGNREIPREHERASYHRKERAEGSFSRTVALPIEIDAERIEARYADGILTIKLPKAEAAKPRQISVRT